jgi:hypothetical protein
MLFPFCVLNIPAPYSYPSPTPRIFFDSVPPAPHLRVTLGMQNILNPWLTEKGAEKYKMTRPHVTMGRINQRRERGIDVLRELHKEKCGRILEEYVGLVLIRRGVLSTGESMKINKSVRVRKVLKLTAMAARRLGARRGYDDAGGTVLGLSDRASRTLCCAVPCLIDLEGARAPRSALRNASA